MCDIKITRLQNVYQFNCYFSAELVRENAKDKIVTLPYMADLQPFYGKGSHQLLWAGSLAARKQITISGIPNRLNYCVISYSRYIIYKYGSGPHNTGWRAEGWSPMPA
jgi:hypothetical protein